MFSTPNRSNLWPKEILSRLSREDHFRRECLIVAHDAMVENRTQDEKRLKHLLRKVPFDMLAIDWLNLEPRDIENRTYLIENVLPQLILGLEDILQEAYSRNLIASHDSTEENSNETADPNFNPVNRLAQFLMRNNHRYNNFSEFSPYVRTMRQATLKLKQEIFMRSENHLAKMKAEAEHLREAAREHQAAKDAENERRRLCLGKVFDAFVTTMNKEAIELYWVRDATYAFLEMSSRLPESLRPHLIPLFDILPADEPPRSLNREDFITLVMSYTKPVPPELFELLTEHLYKCIHEYNRKARENSKIVTYGRTYLSCDLDKLDNLSRENLIDLFDIYTQAAPTELSPFLRDPRDCEFASTRSNTILLLVKT